MLEQIFLWPGEVPKESVDSLAAMYAGLVEEEPFAPSLVSFKNHFQSLSRPVADPESKAILLSLVNSEGLIGFAMGSAVYDSADVDYLWVCPSLRRTGKAKLILDILSDKLRQKGIKNIFLEVSEKNNQAWSLYSAFGFEKINTRPNYYRDGSNAVIMKKELRE